MNCSTHRTRHSHRVNAAIIAATLGLTTIAAGQETVPVTEVSSASGPAAHADQDRIVEMCICLDTSGSMDGLINSARQKLWSIVNDLALAEPTPRLRVALLSYGNDGHAPENGWVKVETEFTEDLDKVSEMLFALTTNGGTELVGRVMQTAIEELDWHQSSDTLRMIFVAGNESADQDSEAPYQEIAKAAINLGIMVNPIYCKYGSDDANVKPGWEQIARLADGQFAMIDQNHGNVIVVSAYDRRLVELSSALNETYIPFGDAGRVGWANQTVQDNNAITMNNEAAASRAVTKASKMYNCSWDLCDALRLDQVDLATIEEEQLPEYMQEMTPEERKAYIEEMRIEREKIQKQIADINARRQAIVLAEQKRQATSGMDGFDLAVRSAIREQARAKGFRYSTSDEQTNSIKADGEHYLVQVAGTWVASRCVDAYERAVKAGSPPVADVTLDTSAEEGQALLAELDETLRESVLAATGRVYLKHGGKSYAVHVAQPEAETVQVDNAAGQQRAQIMSNQGRQTAIGTIVQQQSGQQGAQQQGQQEEQ